MTLSLISHSPKSKCFNWQILVNFKVFPINSWVFPIKIVPWSIRCLHFFSSTNCTKEYDTRFQLRSTFCHNVSSWTSALILFDTRVNQTRSVMSKYLITFILISTGKSSNWKVDTFLCFATVAIFETRRNLCYCYKTV